MFLAFFPILLVALGLVSSSLRGTSGQELAMRLSEILPPGSWQLVSELLLHQEVNAWQWVFLGWVGTLLVGSQVMKLIIAACSRISSTAVGLKCWKRCMTRKARGYSTLSNQPTRSFLACHAASLPQFAGTQSKQDAIRQNQLRWLEAALALDLTAANFLLCEWDII